tara:strand:+ start:333 stop:524 length:192 start_codon:yes stop_codon:yes gene_type:complete
MQHINTKENTSDSIIEACYKINKNFDEVFKKLKFKEPFKVILWEKSEDTKQAMEDINYNFKKI